MAKLCKQQIDEAVAIGRDFVLWDSTLPGFGVRIFPNGLKVFAIQYRNRFGRSRRQSIGRYGVVTLDEARREAKRLLSAVEYGSDPAQERTEDRQCITIRALAARYMTDHCAGRCKESTIAAHQWLLDKFILPALGERAISELTQRDVDRLHQDLKATRYNANRALGLLRAMFGRAAIWGLLPTGANPAAGVRPFRERKRQRFLQMEELGRLANAIDVCERTFEITCYAAAAVRMLICTGARLSEIRMLRWHQVDFEARRLLLAEHKSDARGAKAIPLNRAAIAIIERLRSHSTEGSDYVFLGSIEGRPIADMQKPWRRIRRRAELEDVRIHDLRHSFASFGIAAGASLPLLGGLLGHRTPAATSAYAHLSQEPLRLVSEQIGDAIAGQLFGGRVPYLPSPEASTGE